jgi:hypothetical protein
VEEFEREEEHVSWSVRVRISHHYPHDDSTNDNKTPGFGIYNVQYLHSQPNPQADLKQPYEFIHMLNPEAPQMFIWNPHGEVALQRNDVRYSTAQECVDQALPFMPETREALSDSNLNHDVRAHQADKCR